jgi:hypothetical protein
MNIDTRSLVLVLLASLSTMACSGPPGAATSTSPTSPAIDALTGTYDFVVASSDVGPKLQAQCTASSAGDAAKAAQCWSDAQADAANEKIRFSRNADGQLVFTSFGVDQGQEDVFVEVPIAVRDAEPGVLVATPAGWPHGSLVGQITNLSFERRIERGADGTVVLPDPAKGRLVYRPSR